MAKHTLKMHIATSKSSSNRKIMNKNVKFLKNIQETEFPFTQKEYTITKHNQKYENQPAFQNIMDCIPRVYKNKGRIYDHFNR